MRPRRPHNPAESYCDGDRFPADARSVGAWVKRVVRRLNLPDQNWFEPLARDWPEFAGLPLARHAVPGRFVQSTLYLFVDSAPWLFEIKTRHLAGLTGRIKARYPAVREVRLELNPAPSPRKTGGGSD